MSAASPQTAVRPVRTQPPGPGPLRPGRFPDVHRHQLSNGVPVLIAPVHHFPVVTLGTLVEAGALREPPERAGLADLASDLLESGAGGRTAEEVAEQLEMLGLRADTSVSWDTAYAGLTGLRGVVGPASDILADLVRHPTFPAEEVERLRAQQLAGILQRRALPSGLANEFAARYIFADAAPFSRPLGGTPDSVAALTRDDVRAFHARHYVAGGAAVLIVGDVREDEALKLAEERFGTWGGAGPVAAPAAVEPRTRAPEVVIVHRPGAVQSEIRIGHVGLARSTPDYFAVLVMNGILGGVFSSRLNLNLRERHGYTYGASSGFAMRRLAGPFVAAAAVQTEVTAAAVAETLREMRGMREALVTEAELRDVRNYIAGAFPLRLQTTDGIAGRLAELVVHDLPADYFDHYRERILAVSAEDVSRAAGTHLRPHEAVVLVVGDADAVREPLEQLGHGPVTVVHPNEERTAHG